MQEITRDWDKFSDKEQMTLQGALRVIHDLDRLTDEERTAFDAVLRQGFREGTNLRRAAELESKINSPVKRYVT